MCDSDEEDNCHYCTDFDCTKNKSNIIDRNLNNVFGANKYIIIYSKKKNSYDFRIMNRYVTYDAGIAIIEILRQFNICAIMVRAIN